METLTPAQKTTVTKSSTDRLRLLLMRSGYAEEVVLEMSREQLMNSYAELLAQGLDPATVARVVDPEMEKVRLAHEKEMKQMEMELRKVELAAEAERRDLQKAELLQKERMETERLELERERLRQETGLKTAELEIKDKAANDEVKLIKRYGDALAQVLSPQPDEVTDLPTYFRGIEEQFAKLKIPNKFQARLIYKYLSTRSRALCSRLEPEVRDNYHSMKKAIMKEYGLTAKCFLEKFNLLRKPVNDTYILFASKIRGLLLQYLDARKVSSFDDIVSLLVADRVKASLTDDCLKYVLSVENNLPVDSQQWLKPQRLAEVVDEYVSYTNTSTARSSFIGQRLSAEGRHQSRGYKPATDVNTGGSIQSRTFHSEGDKVQPQGHAPIANRFGRKLCSICKSPFHLRAACNKGKLAPRQVNATVVGRESITPGQDSTHSRGEQSAAQAQVNWVKLDSMSASDPVHTGLIGGGLSPLLADDMNVKTCVKVCEPMLTGSTNCDVDSFDIDVESLISLFDECESPVNDSSDCSSVHVANVQFDMDRFIADSNASLHYVNLIVNDEIGNAVVVDGLFDSGTQLSVIREDVINPLQCDVLGEVKLLGFNGDTSTGKIISLYAKLNANDVSVPIRFVVCQHVTQNCLLSLADYRKLLHAQGVRSDAGQTQQVYDNNNNEESCVRNVQQAQVAVNDDDVGAVDNTAVDNDENNSASNVTENESIDVLPLDNILRENNPSDSKVSELIDEQQADETLSGAFNFAKQNKGGYFIKNGLLFHQTKICENTVERLVVPKGRRQSLLELAHDQVGCHLCTAHERPNRTEFHVAHND